MLYLADTEATAVAEVGGSGILVHVARLKYQGAIKVLDLSFSDSEDEHSDLVQCLARSALCSAPRKGDGWDRPEYVFSRFIADCALKSGFEAIQYSSTKSGAASNFVILAPPVELEKFLILNSQSVLGSEKSSE
jgi:hypothetical protein